MINSLEIEKALALLRKCAPVETVELWIRSVPDGSMRYTARIDGGIGRDRTGPERVRVGAVTG